MQWYLAILSKLAPSDVFRSGRDDQSACNEDIHHVTCDSCGHQISASPFIRKQMRHYFCGVLEVTKQPSRARSKTKVRIEGEVITSDEFLKIMEEQQQQKKSKASKQAGVRNETTPTQTETSYSTDSDGKE